MAASIEPLPVMDHSVAFTARMPSRMKIRARHKMDAARSLKEFAAEFANGRKGFPVDRLVLRDGSSTVAMNMFGRANDRARRFEPNLCEAGAEHNGGMDHASRRFRLINIEIGTPFIDGEEHRRTRHMISTVH